MPAKHDLSAYLMNNPHDPPCPQTPDRYGESEGAIGHRKTPEAPPMFHDTCTCSHPAGDHRNARTTFPHPPRYGACLVPGCDCRAFTPESLERFHRSYERQRTRESGR